MGDAHGTGRIIPHSDCITQYFLRLDNGNGFLRDTIGHDFADFETVRRHAVRGGANIVADALSGEEQAVKLTFHIEDADNRPVATMSMTVQLDCDIHDGGRADGDISTVPLYP